MSYQMSDPVKLKLLADFELILYFIERIDRQPISKIPELFDTYLTCKESCLDIIDILRGELK